MFKTIEVYVRNEIVSGVYREMSCEHTATGQVDIGRPTSKLQFRKIRRLPEADEKALDVVLEVANKKGWKVKVYNADTFTGRLKARLKGINETPTVIVGKHRIKGVPQEQDLLSFSDIEGGDKPSTLSKNSLIMASLMKNNSRGSLAWFGRQTHNLENKTGQSPSCPEVAGSNPAPGTILLVNFKYKQCYNSIGVFSGRYRDNQAKGNLRLSSVS